mmetsp:Transcript_20079/g.27980  ORF Transcript_20079/g.27980 Transcript_20079/m.27980 type:complete len:235 (+) Transcript_20079:133-837(+)|eukprot:CAMPEP_0184484706 /NCGR_PEP_ID=MMETSP0113_2-20130426/6387_1 /TAXON_ID=91329 /ORGANISM="Norrisiella sphaerica, Strain BC52" /LENGTH=234 /DNA_ID=CAMNT_0026865807 /DNA_START=99 /DNA_END=803 /DNA_ORIENTATION=+
MSFADAGRQPKTRQPRPTARTEPIEDPYERDFRQQKMEELKEDVDQGLDNLLKTTDEIVQIGADTNLKLYAQGDQMRKAMEDIDDVHENLDSADYHMAKMELCCCFQLCCCCCTCCEPERKITARKFKSGAKGFNEPLMSKAPRDTQGVLEPRNKRVDNPYEDGQGMDSEEKFDARCDAKLDGVLKAVKDIKELSDDMHEEIQYQNRELIPALSERVDETRLRVKTADRRAKRL